MPGTDYPITAQQTSKYVQKRAAGLVVRTDVTRDDLLCSSAKSGTAYYIVADTTKDGQPHGRYRVYVYNGAAGWRGNHSGRRCEATQRQNTRPCSHIVAAALAESIHRAERGMA